MPKTTDWLRAWLHAQIPPELTREMIEWMHDAFPGDQAERDLERMCEYFSRIPADYELRARIRKSMRRKLAPERYAFVIERFSKIPEFEWEKEPLMGPIPPSVLFTWSETALSDRMSDMIDGYDKFISRSKLQTPIPPPLSSVTSLQKGEEEKAQAPVWLIFYCKSPLLITTVPPPQRTVSDARETAWKVENMILIGYLAAYAQRKLLACRQRCRQELRALSTLTSEILRATPQEGLDKKKKHSKRKHRTK